jgi:Spy/CpxP family protein refolding chaperone
MRVLRLLMAAAVAVTVLGGTVALGTTAASAATVHPACTTGGGFCSPGW